MNNWGKHLKNFLEIKEDTEGDGLYQLTYYHAHTIGFTGLHVEDGLLNSANCCL